MRPIFAQHLNLRLTPASSAWWSTLTSGTPSTRRGRVSCTSGRGETRQTMNTTHVYHQFTKVVQVPPHLFAASDGAYAQMMNNTKDQSMLVSFAFEDNHGFLLPILSDHRRVWGRKNGEHQKGHHLLCHPRSLWGKEEEGRRAACGEEGQLGGQDRQHEPNPRVLWQCQDYQERQFLKIRKIHQNVSYYVYQICLLFIFLPL